MPVYIEPPRPVSEDTRAWTIHGQDTLPRLFRHVVKERGDAVAMREKHLGIWRSVTWRQYGLRARHVGLGLVALGFQPRSTRWSSSRSRAISRSSSTPPAPRARPRAPC